MLPRIKVVEIVKNFDVEKGGGGIGRFVFALSQAINKEKFDITVAALWHYNTTFEDQWIERMKAEGIDAFAASPWDPRRPYRSFLRSLKEMRDRLKKKPPSILHSHSEFGDMAAIILKTGPSSPAVLRTVHYGYKHEWRKRPLRRILLSNFLYPLMMTREIGVSQTIADALDQRHIARLLKHHALYINNAIDLNRFKKSDLNTDAKKQALGVPANATLIGTIGRLSEQKGYSYFLEAISILHKNDPNFYFLIIGDGELRKSLEAQAENLGITSRVVFAGSRKDIEELLPCMDLFVSSSLWEGLPTVILESMAAGVPIVATDIPGTRELITDRENGWLAPPRNSQALASKIKQAIQERNEGNIYKTRAFETAAAFSIEAVARKHEELYELLLSNKPNKPSELNC